MIKGYNSPSMNGSGKVSFDLIMKVRRFEYDTPCDGGCMPRTKMEWIEIIAGIVSLDQQNKNWDG